MKKNIALIGGGPAGLMAAEVLSNNLNVRIDFYEKRSAVGRKILIAGSSGLNISNSDPIDSFIEKITPVHFQEFFRKHFQEFFTSNLLDFIHQELQLETFLGTSKRYFLKEKNAATFLRTWINRLKSKGVNFYLDHQLQDFNFSQMEIYNKRYDKIGLFLGGGSWEDSEVMWPQIFKDNNINCIEFQSSNAGFQIDWPEGFLKENLNKPLKNILFTSSLGSMKGDLMITSYGIEGTPVYRYGLVGEVFLDLLPQYSESQILEKMNVKLKENYAPLRLLKKVFSGLGEVHHSLLYYYFGMNKNMSTSDQVKKIKFFPLHLIAQRPLAEAISSRGGIDLNEVSVNLSLKKFPHIFVGGEMLNWDAPTGGYLFQTCMTQGYVAGHSVLANVNEY